MSGGAPTVFDAVGGRPWFDALAAAFYRRVQQDPVLAPLYPDDLAEPTRHLAGFLAQYWGGGVEQYSAERGHPRLRMRHAPFAIGEAEREAWVAAMTGALDEMDPEPAVRAAFDSYVTDAAAFLVNVR